MAFRRCLKAAGVILAAFFIPATQAGQFTINWTNPTERTDGSPITLSEIAGLYVYYDCNSGEDVGVKFIPGTPTSDDVDVMAEFGVCEAYMRAEDTNGLISANSNTVIKDLGAFPLPAVLDSINVQWAQSEQPPTDPDPPTEPPTMARRDVASGVALAASTLTDVQTVTVTMTLDNAGVPLAAGQWQVLTLHGNEGVASSPDVRITPLAGVGEAPWTIHTTLRNVDGETDVQVIATRQLNGTEGLTVDIEFEDLSRYQFHALVFDDPAVTSIEQIGPVMYHYNGTTDPDMQVGATADVIMPAGSYAHIAGYKDRSGGNPGIEYGSADAPFVTPGVPARTGGQMTGVAMAEFATETTLAGQYIIDQAGTVADRTKSTLIGFIGDPPAGGLSAAQSDLYWYAVTDVAGVDVRVNNTGDTTYDTVPNAATPVAVTTGGDVVYALPGDNVASGSDPAAGDSTQKTAIGAALDMSYPRTFAATVRLPTAQGGASDRPLFGAIADSFDYVILSANGFTWDHTIREGGNNPVFVDSGTGDNLVRPDEHDNGDFFAIVGVSRSSTQHELWVYNIESGAAMLFTDTTEALPNPTDTPDQIAYSAAASNQEVLQAAWYRTDWDFRTIGEFFAAPYDFLDDFGAGPASITATQAEGGDTQSAAITSPRFISAVQVEQGDTTSAALDAVELEASLTAAQTEAGDTQSAAITTPVTITAAQNEAGDTQSASVEGVPVSQITPTQDEAGDETNAAFASPRRIAATQVEPGDTTSAAFVSTPVATLSATQVEPGDQTQAGIVTPVALAATQAEQGDTTSAAFETIQVATLTVAQAENGDVTEASLTTPATVTATQVEDGDTQVAALGSTAISTLTVTQAETGDTTTAAFESERRITAVQAEAGDTTDASITSPRLIVATQVEAGDTQSAAFGNIPVSALTVAQTETGDVQAVVFEAVASLTAAQAEAGDVTIAAFTGTLTASIAANQDEAGDVQSAAFESQRFVSAAQAEAGDESAAQLRNVVSLFVNQPEPGDTQTAFLRVTDTPISNITANQTEVGDTQAAWFGLPPTGVTLIVDTPRRRFNATVSRRRFRA